MSARTGVAFLDHTADVGIAVAAQDLETLFHRAALAMLDLLRGLEEEDVDGGRGPTWPERRFASEAATIELAVEAEGPARLLADWLRELLFLHEVEHCDYVSARFNVLEPTRLSAAVRTGPSAGAVREIKGVTYHELRVEEVEGGWRARVIFDV